MTSKTQIQLETATGIKRKPEEMEQLFLERILVSVADLPQDAWEKLSEETQAWYNAAVAAANASQPIPPFTVEAATNSTEPQASAPAEPPPEQKKKKTAKGAAAPKPQAKIQPGWQKRASKPRTGSQQMVIRIVLERPQISVNEIADLLTQAGVKHSRATISTMVPVIRATLDAILKKQIGEEGATT